MLLFLLLLFLLLPQPILILLHPLLFILPILLLLLLVVFILLLLLILLILLFLDLFGCHVLRSAPPPLSWTLHGRQPDVRRTVFAQAADTEVLVVVGRVGEAAACRGSR